MPEGGQGIWADARRPILPRCARRKKSRIKTFNPGTSIRQTKLKEVMDDGSAPIHQVIEGGGGI
jgi:hypothetical protein